jgi:hypothetical protein
LTRVSAKLSSSTAHTGFQYTPVASIATWRTPRASSQSRNANNPDTVVLNSATSSVNTPIGPNAHTRRHADLVNVKRARALDYPFHILLLPVDDPNTPSAGASRSQAML